jgi:hypothetical protein
MFILLFVMVFFESYSASSPPPIIPLVELREILTSDPQHPQHANQMRTYFDIVWSCLSTLFICTWVRTHPIFLEEGQNNCADARSAGVGTDFVFPRWA